MLSTFLISQRGISPVSYISGQEKSYILGILPEDDSIKTDKYRTKKTGIDQKQSQFFHICQEEILLLFRLTGGGPVLIDKIDQIDYIENVDCP